MQCNSILINNKDHFSVSDNTFWTLEKRERLCELWRQNAYIFNTKKCHDKVLRNRTLENFAGVLGSNKNEVRRRMINMRSQYAREKKRDLKSVWHFFPLLDFLDEYQIDNTDLPTLGEVYIKKVVSLPHNSDSGEPSGESSSNNNGNRTQQVRNTNEDQHQQRISQKRPFLNTSSEWRSRRRKIEPTQFLNSSQNRGQKNSGGGSLRSSFRVQPPLESNGNVQQSSETTRNSPDVNDVYAQYIACEIRALRNPQAQQLAKLRIQQVLFEVQNSLPMPSMTTALSDLVNSYNTGDNSNMDESAFSGISSPSGQSEADSYMGSTSRTKYSM